MAVFDVVLSAIVITAIPNLDVNATIRDCRWERGGRYQDGK